MTRQIILVLLCLVSAPNGLFAQWTAADYGLTPNATPIGFVDASGPGATLGISQMTTVLPRKGGTFTATLSTQAGSGLEFRHRTDMVGDSVADMMGDLAGTRGPDGGQMNLVLSGLLNGYYQFRSWHNDANGSDPGFATGSTFDITLDGVLVVDDLTASNTTDPSLVATASFQAQVQNGDDLSIQLTHVDHVPSASKSMVLNGWRILRLDYWGDDSDGNAPTNATTATGTSTAICRFKVGNGLFPGRVFPGTGCHAVRQGSGDVETDLYEVLVDSTASWQSYTGTLPANAIVGGNDPHNRTLYICQTAHPSDPNTMVPGKLKNNRGSCMIVSDISVANPLGTVHEVFSDFDVLVQD